jgi:hypothetical protein
MGQLLRTAALMPDDEPMALVPIEKWLWSRHAERQTLPGDVHHLSLMHHTQPRPQNEQMAISKAILIKAT